MLALLLTVALAFAEADVQTDVSPADPPPPPPAAPLSLEEAWAVLPAQDLLHEGIERRLKGDREGSRQRFEALLNRDELPALATYHVAVNDEIEERYFEALQGYEAVIAGWPDDPLVRDARFRRAVVLEDLGMARDAARQVKQLQRSEEFDQTDGLAMALVRGSAELRAGKGRGARRIGAALAELEGSDRLAWARARARMALASQQLDQAAKVAVVNDKRARDRLERRVGHLEAAMEEVTRIASLGEPEYALNGLLALGDGFMRLYDDILASADPPGLSPEQLTIFREELVQSSDVVRVRAWKLYDEGVTLAARVQWQGKVAEQLRARREAAAAKAP